MGNRIYRINEKLYTYQGYHWLRDGTTVCMFDIEAGESVYLPMTDELGAMLKSKASVAYTAYRDGKCEFGKDEEGNEYLLYNNKKYLLTSHPYEPCMYIKSDEREIIFHNSFDVCDLPEFFRSHKMLHSITGRGWDIKRFCALLCAVIDSGRTELDISEAEKLVSFDYEAEYPYNILCRLIRSEEVADAAMEQEVTFSPEEIAAFIYHCSQSYEQMCELFDLCEGTPAEKAAEKLREKLEKQLESIKRKEDGCLFEVRIHDAGNTEHFDSHLCDSYESALLSVDEYKKEYKAYSDKPQYYSIRKRKINRGNDIPGDFLGEIDFFPNDEIKHIYLLHDEDKPMASSMEFRLPTVFRRTDIIKVAGETDRYYVCTENNQKELDGVIYCVPLDTLRFRYGDYSDLFAVHEHISLYKAQRVKYSELSADLQIVYERLRAFLLDEESGETIRCTFRITVNGGNMYLMKKALDVLCNEFRTPIPKVIKREYKKNKFYLYSEGSFTMSPDNVTKDYLMTLLWKISRGIGHSMNFADGTKEFMLGEPGGNYYIVISCNPVMK